MHQIMFSVLQADNQCPNYAKNWFDFQSAYRPNFMKVIVQKNFLGIDCNRQTAKIKTIMSLKSLKTSFFAHFDLELH